MARSRIVGQTEVKSFALQEPLGGAGQAGDAHGETHPFQPDGQWLANIGLVVDDDYSRLRHLGYCSATNSVAVLAARKAHFAEAVGRRDHSPDKENSV